MEAPLDALLPRQIRCQGQRSNGQSCRWVLATVVDGAVVHKHDGWEIEDPGAIRCPKCGTERRFREGDVLCGAGAAA